MTLGKQRRFVRLLAFLVLLGAILPQLTFVGHWSLPGLADETAAHAQAEGHANHCHGDSACANQQTSFVGTWWVGDDPESLIFDAIFRAFDLSEPEIVLDSPVFRLTPPPRSA